MTISAANAGDPLGHAAEASCEIGVGMSVVLPLRDSIGQATLPVRTQRALKVFVTGGNGFIGSVVVRLLHAAGHTVRVLVRPAANTQRIDAIPAERVVGDVRDGALLRRAIEGRSRRNPSGRPQRGDLIDSPEMGGTSQGGTAGVLAAARATPGVRVIHVSSVLAVGSTPHARANRRNLSLPSRRRQAAGPQPPQASGRAALPPGRGRRA